MIEMRKDCFYMKMMIEEINRIEKLSKKTKVLFNPHIGSWPITYHIQNFSAINVVVRRKCKNDIQNK